MIEGKRRRGLQRMRLLDGITNSINKSEQTLGNSEGQWSLVCYSPWVCKESDTTSVQSLSHVRLFATPWTEAYQFSLSITNSQSLPRAYPCPLSQWCHLTISSSVIPLSSCLQSFPASGSFQISQFFPSGGQSTGVSALASVLPMNIQDWFPLERTGWISLQSKGLSRIFSNTMV